MDLYNGKINEFVDWVSGRNSLTGTTVGQVSGGSIRELLLSRLKEPFYMHEDPANNKYRMFSSREAYSIWKDNPTDNQDLELFTFVRPSDYKLELVATNSDGFNNKFIRYGDRENVGARIAFQWDIYNDEGSSSDSLSATYTISNNSTGSSTTFTRWYNKSDANPDFSIYEYLQPGENTVNIECKGVTTGARNLKSFTIILLQINVSSTFKFYEKHLSSSIVPILVPYVFERNNTSGTAKIHFVVDNGGEGKEYTRDVVQDGPTKITEIQAISAQLSEGTHTLQIWAEAKYNGGNVTVNSNLLYYTFTIASTVIGSVNKFINIASSFDNGDFPLSSLMLGATQYESLTLLWGYYTDGLLTDTSISVTWKLKDGLDDLNPTTLSVITANNQEKAANLLFIPSIYTQEDHETFLCAYFGDTLILAFPIYIIKNTKIIVNEAGFYEIKMSAYGKTNESVTKDLWQDVYETVNTTFTNVQWNSNSGWHNNSFRTSGQNEYAIIDFDPFDTFDFTNGKTIEIEFESEKVSSFDDKIIVIGNSNGARIEITPDTATLFDNSNNEIVHTNYKSNERLKLAFIINNILEESELNTVESGLAYIVNNGILERAASASGKSFNTEGAIKIGGTNSGVRVYNIRVYNYALTCTQAYENYLYDSEDKIKIANNNRILDAGGNINFDLCKNKLDTILISGNLTNILSGSTDKENSATNVTVQRFCPSDSSKNFKLNNLLIRKHGQSTLNYPITSMKMWFNKSTEGTVPLYEQTQLSDLLLNKNRYVMKSATDGGKPSIPANKFVLQANYADSSGTHNGGFERLIQETWFKARIDGEFKLRTEPLLFSTNLVVHHNNTSIGEDGTWVEGYSNVPSKTGIQWKDVTNYPFPYDIRIAPDSFPCAVFYYDEEGSRVNTFLGQYVWMDDKKSDFCYGERSIYSIPTDPFCLTNTHKDDDTDENLVWDNKNVLRVEVIGSNHPFTSYMTHDNFNDIVMIQQYDLNNNPIGVPKKMYNWEQVFEMVYPDPDDVEGRPVGPYITSKGKLKYQDVDTTKFAQNSEFIEKAQPFIDFHEWVVSTYHDQAKFEAEAAQHLDLYKMAAYYIFVLRFGLVDSLERNALIKTYDGVHWHYEPWDMDIALGNKNDGGIAFDPPIDRNTKLPGSQGTYAISGRSANDNGVIITSNWLFDALEAWDEWIENVVKKVADALYVAGLDYNSVVSMLDDNYASKWCELMYNASGLFKYVKSGNGDDTWLSWLQGARTTHRHWWLSTSMDYYDAKWFCGDYKNHYVYLRANVPVGSLAQITIVPNKQTYMSVTKDGVLQTTLSVNQASPFVYSMSGGSATKNPISFYGANFMESIDVSQIAHGLDGITLDGVYSEVLGSPLKSLNVGVSITANTDLNTDADYVCTLASLGCLIQGNARVFENLLYLNIRGQINQKSLNTFVYNNNITALLEVRAMGSGLTDFYSSQYGNSFTDIELPDTVYTIYMNNSTWQNMTFWHTTSNTTNVADILEQGGYTYGTDEYYDALEALAQSHPEYFESNAYIKQVTDIPTTIHDVSFLGTTGSTQSSILFVKAWLAALTASSADLSQYTLVMDKINWTDTTVGLNNLLTFDELSKLAQLSNRTSLKGYIVLKDTGVDLTAEQLNTIKGWFGDTVFTRNSSGLIIDHKRQYILINLGGDVVIEPWTYTDPVSGTTISGNTTIVEGHTASLNATRFSLAEDDPRQYSWAIGAPDSNEGSGRYQGLSVIQAEDTIDHIAYLLTEQSLIGHDYYAKVYTAVSGLPYTAYIRVIAATYPDDMFINIRNESTTLLKLCPGYIEFPATNTSASFYVDSNQTYSGVVRSITYTVKNLLTNNQVSYTVGETGENLEAFRDEYISVRKSTTTDGIKITVDAAIPNTMLNYTLTARVSFVSGKTITIVNNMIIQDDMTAVVPSAKPAIFNPLADTWLVQFGQQFTKNSFYKIDLMAITNVIDFSNYSLSITNFVTSNDDILFNYLPNCKGIIIDGCTSLTNNTTINGDTVNQMDFSNMTKMEKFSAKYCSGLIGTIDLSACTNLKEVDTSGIETTSASNPFEYILHDSPNLNVIIADGLNIEKYKLGAPSTVRIVDQDDLSYSNIVVDRCKNVTSLVIKNVPDSKSFATFTKIAMDRQEFYSGLMYYSPKMPLPELSYNYTVYVIFKIPIKLYSSGWGFAVPRWGDNNYYDAGRVGGNYDYTVSGRKYSFTKSVGDGVNFFRIQEYSHNLYVKNPKMITEVEAYISASGHEDQVLYHWINPSVTGFNTLTISQNNIPENMEKEYFHYLYETVKNSTNVELKGYITVDKAYESEINYLKSISNNQLTIPTPSGGYYVEFDQDVKKDCLSGFGDGVGITQAQALGITDIDNCFRGRTDVTSFDDLSTKLPNLIRLADNVFTGCSNLTSVDFTNIQLLGCATFEGTGLTGIINMPNLTEIKSNSGVWGCYGSTFKNTTITELNAPNLTKIIGGSASNGSRDVLQTFPTTLQKITLDNAEYIGMRAFLDCSLLSDIGTYGDLRSVKQLGADAFYGCTSLAIHVNMPNLESLPTAARASGNLFMNSGILSIDNIGTVVTAVWSGFAGYCTSLRSVVIPSQITVIGQNAFTGCTSLQWVKLECTTPPELGQTTHRDWRFSFENTTCKFYVPDSADDSVLNAYRTGQYGWSGMSSRIFPMSQFAIDFPNG